MIALQKIALASIILLPMLSSPARARSEIRPVVKESLPWIAAYAPMGRERCDKRVKVKGKYQKSPRCLRVVRRSWKKYAAGPRPARVRGYKNHPYRFSVVFAYKPQMATKKWNVTVGNTRAKLVRTRSYRGYFVAVYTVSLPPGHHLVSVRMHPTGALQNALHFQAP